LGYISAAVSAGVSSTTFTECAQKATKFSEITHGNSHYAIQGHRVWYQSKARMRLPITD